MYYIKNDFVGCGNVSVISNGDITLIDEGNTTYGALAEVTCNTGYNKTINIIECHDTGEWDVPACYLIDCGDVPTISNGTIYLKEVGNTTYGAIAEVVCENGYNETLDIIECRNTGEWDAVECYLIDCGILPPIDNGSIALIDDGNSSFGALAEVTCYIGHNATLKTIMCRDTGKWDNTSCEIINCGDVPTISNGTIDLKEVGNTTYGALAEVVCEHGFNETLDIIECRETGEWDVVGCCLIDCGILPPIDNGSIALKEDGNSSFGALAEVTCNIGNNATKETIMCRGTGKWDNTSCKIISMKFSC
ncbi:sushi, von Willebrand factor type A, EGF and pentraxin domain-containing protein 1-like [Ruditapes philippinarum]|uniref:sushi, von Willebrand factor type A, EGF and pentraxin domain-containing protein 1-like n=1 Tax=Ruditapes philippinarum TaxID=129788 RepID=UPI00295A5C5B|nr:sushi, von Willebrand factor type A, EGF and pentraxin domain-containing protein 1-like [Ruditapes philippinarum]